MTHEPELMRESKADQQLFGSLTFMTEGEWEELVQALRQTDASCGFRGMSIRIPN